MENQELKDRVTFTMIENNLTGKLAVCPQVDISGLDNNEIEKLYTEITKWELTEQVIKDEHEQAVKRGGEKYADNYIEGLKDGAKYYFILTPSQP